MGAGRGCAATEETATTGRLEKSRRGRLAAYWLASGPADSVNDRCRSGWFLVSIQREIPLFAEFLARIYDRSVCNPGADGEASIGTAAVPSGAIPMRKDGLEGKPVFAAQKKAPPHDLRVGRGRCTDLAFPNARAERREGRWRLVPESTGALGAPG
jgi:hypothetical protein